MITYENNFPVSVTRSCGKFFSYFTLLINGLEVKGKSGVIYSEL
jgi:hypothetical protein